MAPDPTPPRHIPVMLEEVLQWLAPAPGSRVLDGTVGLAGHSQALALAIGPAGTLIGLDRDPHALDIARLALSGAACKVHLVHSAFSLMQEALEQLGLSQVDRILLDLGVSSLQLDSAERGFSFGKAGPLDMRMDPTWPTTAEQLVHTLSEPELIDLFRTFGEERFSRRIAKRIVATRASETINSTEKLAQLVADAVPGRGRRHPATRVFQALRIAVNNELGELQQGLKSARACLAPGGRLAILSFHSLEDRLVKTTFRAWDDEGYVRLLRRKVIKPSRQECALNRRARSAKLRICEVVSSP